VNIYHTFFQLSVITYIQLGVKSLRTFYAITPPTQHGRDTPIVRLSSHHFTIMSNLDNFTTVISGNRRRNQQWSPEAKAAMLSRLAAGEGPASVARAFQTRTSTVTYIRDQFNKHGTVQNRPRSGRPPLLSRAERRYIIRMIYKDRQISWDSLVNGVDCRVSKSTVRRVVRSHFKRKWKVMERPKLDKDKARIRLHWATSWLRDVDELMQVWTFKVTGSVALTTG
jgi:transposase